jgi:hypothetical protein
MSKRRGYIVLWDGVPARYADGRLYRGYAGDAWRDWRRVSYHGSLLPSLRVARNAIQATRREMGCDAVLVEAFTVTAIALPTASARGGR